MCSQGGIMTNYHFKFISHPSTVRIRMSTTLLASSNFFLLLFTVLVFDLK